MSSEAHLDDDLLIDLAHHLLHPAESIAALHHLKACPPCADRFRSVAASRELALAREELVLGRRVVEQIAPAITRHVTPTWRWIWRPLAAAAVLALVLFRPQSWDPESRSEPNSTRELARRSAWLPDPEASVLQREAEDAVVEPTLRRALKAYRQRDLRFARDLLLQANTEGVAEEVRLIYLGSTELQLGRPQASLAALQRVRLDLVPEPWRGEALWSLYLSHRLGGHKEAADSLRRILSVRGDAIGARARDGAPGASVDR